MKLGVSMNELRTKFFERSRWLVEGGEECRAFAHLKNALATADDWACARVAAVYDRVDRKYVYVGQADLSELHT